MADIDIVLERLVTDTGFRQQLSEDPAAALSPYVLSAEDLQLLAGSLDGSDGGQRGVEQRTSKSAVIGLLASLTSSGGSGNAGSAKYSGPINVTHDTTIRTSGSSGPPLLDGSSKEAGGGHQQAPPDEALHKLPGKPKPGEITLTRSQAVDHGRDGHLDIKNQNPIGVDAPAATSDAQARGGFLKIPNGRNEQLTSPPAPEGVAGGATWQSSPVGARVAPDGSGKAGGGDFHTIKMPNAKQQSPDQIAPSGSGGAAPEDFHHIKLKGDGNQDRRVPPSGDCNDSDSFLSIEDE